jgi:hypothetical protein
MHAIKVLTSSKIWATGHFSAGGDAHTKIVGNNFPIGSSSPANHHGYLIYGFLLPTYQQPPFPDLCTNHLHASTYLLVTCLPTYLPTYLPCLQVTLPR